MEWVKHLKKVFYFELLLNLVSCVQIFFMTDAFVTGFGATPSPALNTSFTWFGSLIVVITYIMGRALLSGNEKALRYVLEGYLIGDLVYVVTLVMLVNAIGGVWTPIAIFSGVISLILAAVRGVYLWGHAPKV